MLDPNTVFPPTDVPIAEVFNLHDLLGTAATLTADAQLRDEDDDRPPTNSIDTIGLTELAYRWFQAARSQITPAEVTGPGMLFYFQNGHEYGVQDDKITSGDLDAAATSRMAEAVACLAGAWWAVQQAAHIDAMADNGSEQP